MLELNNSENHLSFGFQDNISDDFGNKGYDEVNTSSNDSYQNISIDENGKEKVYLEERSLNQIIRGKKLNEEQKLERIKQYIKEGYDINTQTEKKGDTLLHYASFNRSVKIIKYLIEQKADIHLKNKEGELALHYAAYQGKLEIIKLFIEGQNINPNITDNSGSTPLHHASSNGRLQAVKYLIEERNVDPNIKDKYGSTPLHRAFFPTPSHRPHSEERRLLVAKYLIEELNVDPNIKDKYGSTPLHHASSNGRLEAIKYLIEKDADFNVKNQEGNTPLELAKKNKRDDVVSYLKLQNSKRMVSNTRFALTILCLTVIPYVTTLYASIVLLIMTFSLTKLLTHRIEESCKGISEQNDTLPTTISSEFTSVSPKLFNNRYIQST